jgi:hypothetical protein
MNFSFLWSGRRKKQLLCGGLSFILLVLVSCAFLRIWHPRDIEAYLGMASECHPVWRQFALRRFGAGDSVSDLLQRYPPSRREEFGRYGVYRYNQCDSNGIPFTGLSVITRDGRLLSAGAGSCTWQFSFFHTQDTELDRQYAVFMTERHKKFARQHLERLETELRKFYSQHCRWPTNQEEFSYFVTGSQSVTTNDLGITLVQRPDGVVDMTLVELPDEKRSVTKPDGASP